MTKLEEYIKGIGMSKADIARISGLNSGHVSQIISGKINIPRSKTLEKLADTINMPVKELSCLIKESYSLENPDDECSDKIYLNRNNVRVKIHEAEMSQKMVSERLGIKQSTFSKYINMKNPVSKEIIDKLAIELKCDKRELMLNNEKVTIVNETELENLEPPILTDKRRNTNTETTLRHVIIKQHPQDRASTLPVTQTCTKCMFESVVNIQINSDFSYPADTIQRWARRSICKMTDRDSVDYNPEMAELISDMLFNYFINKKTPLRTDARYFVRQKKGRIHLKRDRGEMESLRMYIISRSDEYGNHATRMVMTESEKDKVETILRDLNVNFVIRDIVDILK